MKNLGTLKINVNQPENSYKNEEPSYFQASNYMMGLRTEIDPRLKLMTEQLHCQEIEAKSKDREGTVHRLIKKIK